MAAPCGETGKCSAGKSKVVGLITAVSVGEIRVMRKEIELLERTREALQGLASFDLETFRFSDFDRAYREDPRDIQIEC